MAARPLPPLISSDGHLEVVPERWTPRMPVRYRDQAPRTIKLPDGGDAILVEGQAPYPVPFLDLRAGRTNETWQPFGVTVEDTAGVGPPEQRIREQDMDGLHAEVLFPNMQVCRPNERDVAAVRRDGRGHCRRRAAGAADPRAGHGRLARRSAVSEHAGRPAERTRRGSRSA